MVKSANAPSKLCAGVIEKEIRGRLSVAIHTTVLEAVGSTNSWLSERRTLQTEDASVSTDLWVCAAEQQTSGRGRRGKIWHTPVGGVTFSLCFNVAGAPSEIGGLSLLVGAAVCDSLREWSVEDAMIKWPNDILINNAKLVGILVEVAGHSKSSTSLIVGIGVNYQRGAEQKKIDQASTDLHDQCDGSPPDRSLLIGHLAAEVYQRCCSGSLQASMTQLAADWPRYDAFAGATVMLKSGSSPVVEGKSDGIDNIGRLRLLTGEGLLRVSSGEASIRRR